MFGGTLRHRLAYLAAITLLAACNGDPEPIEPTGPPPTSEATPSNGNGPPEMPDLALEDTEAGAIAFVEHYIDVFNYAANTGDVEPLRALSHPDCEGCESYAQSFEERHANGGRTDGFRWAVMRSATKDNIVEVVIAADSYEYAEDQSESPRTIDPAEYEVGFELNPPAKSRQVARMYEVID